MSNTKRAKTHDQLIVAIDFDKTICDTQYPLMGDLFENAKEVINKLYAQGAYIIIWTCRTGKAMYEAEAFLLAQGINFHKINDHHPNGMLNYGTERQMEHQLESRKVWSHILIDDTSLDWMLNGHPGWHSIDEDVQQVIRQNPDHWDIKPDNNYNYLTNTEENG